MKDQAKVVVIGGGVVGCSVLYHLAKAGWTDIMLIERSELTSGSSWHAAGGFHTLNGDPNVAKLQAYTVQLYKEIEEISGQSCSLHLTGGVMMADTPERQLVEQVIAGRMNSGASIMPTKILAAAPRPSAPPMPMERVSSRASWVTTHGNTRQ